MRNGVHGGYSNPRPLPSLLDHFPQSVIHGFIKKIQFKRQEKI